MGLQEARMKSRAGALVQYDRCPYDRRDKDMTTSRGRSCGLTVRRRPPTGQEENHPANTPILDCHTGKQASTSPSLLRSPGQWAQHKLSLAHSCHHPVLI